LRRSQIEGDERGLCAAAFGHESTEVAAPVDAQHHRLAVDEGPVHIEAADTASAKARQDTSFMSDGFASLAPRIPALRPRTPRK
jgi:hypothetical protein